VIPLTIGQALVEARFIGVDRLDAQLLLARLLDRPRSWLLAHDDDRLDESQVSRLREWLQRRAGGEPLAYLLGEKEFHGLTLGVNADVLVPRPETELLVDWGLELLTGMLREPARAPIRAVDLGTGSGAIALATKNACPAVQVTATDFSERALNIAKANARRLGLSIEFRHGDWWECLPSRTFHVIMSNPPYVDPDDPHLQDLHHEPRVALTPGHCGLAALAAIVDGAVEHLVPGGWLILEHGHDQGPAVRDLLLRAGFVAPHTRNDLAGLPRCTGAQGPRTEGPAG